MIVPGVTRRCRSPAGVLNGALGDGDGFDIGAFDFSRGDVDGFDQFAGEWIVFGSAGPDFAGEFEGNFFNAGVEEFIDRGAHVDVVAEMIVVIAREGPGGAGEDILSRGWRGLADFEDAALFEIFQIGDGGMSLSRLHFGHWIIPPA